MTATEAERGGLVQFRAGGNEVPYRKNLHPKCRVCRSPYVDDLEEFVVIKGLTYKQALSLLPPPDESIGQRALSVHSMSEHFGNDHLDRDLVITQSIKAERAAQLGRSLEDHAGLIVDGITLLRTVQQKTFEDIASGKQKPDIKEGLAAVKMLADLGEYDGGGVSGLDVQSVIDALMAYHEAAEEFLPADSYAAFNERLMANPILQALAKKFDGEDDIYDAEVVETPALEAAARDV